MKKLILITYITLILSGCAQINATDSPILSFNTTSKNYSVNNLNKFEKYNKLNDQLNEFENIKNVCALTTSTANLLYELGANLTAAPNSDMLLQQIKEKQNSGEILNLGSALTPNIEIYKKAKCDITFVADSMPHSKDYENIDNLVQLAQTNYEDLFITISVLNSNLNFSKSQEILNDLITSDQTARKSLSSKIEEAPILQFTPDGLYSSKNNSFVSSMARQIGIENSLDSIIKSDSPITNETLLNLNPEYIIIYAHNIDKSIITNFINSDKFKEIDAVKNNNVIILDQVSNSADLNSTHSLQSLINTVNEVKK